MTHIWIRAESRDNEERTGITPTGAAELIAAGYQVTVEESRQRAIAADAYRASGCRIVTEGSWSDAPEDAIIFGLKELPDDGSPLRHRHIMFGHAYKGQSAGQVLLARFRAGGGSLLDLEYLVDDAGRRVAAFGYWAGFAGAAVALLAWAAQQRGDICGPVRTFSKSQDLVDDVRSGLAGARPSALIIGALGRVGTGASDLCKAVGVAVTPWDMAETATGGPFPEVLEHDVFLNCILAGPGTPVFVPQSALAAARRLTVIGDIACDPGSDFSPVKVYDHTTDWVTPALRVHGDPVLDVVAIDNLPAMLPVESSDDFAGQLLPHLLGLSDADNGVWDRARQMFAAHVARLG